MGEFVLKHFLARTWAQIDLDALCENFTALRAFLPPSCTIMAVVKADAYGHGAVMAAKALTESGADRLAVSNLDEAVQLRQAGITCPILVLSYTPPEETDTLITHHITQTVVCASHARALSVAARKAGSVLNIHIKLDTGMSRVGFFCQQPNAEIADEIAAVCALPGLRAEGIFTHFSTADESIGEDSGFTCLQFDSFCRMLRLLEQRGIHFSFRHCCNSAAALQYPDMHLDMVRPGIILYGLYPNESLRRRLSLKPVMSLLTHVSQVKTVPPGSTVSYGRRFTAREDTALATVPIGYADGYTRRVGPDAYMLINGRPAPICGRICMDQCMLNITGIPNVQAGTVATAFGQSENSFLPVETYASWSGTINYEVVCSIGKRVPRVYLWHNEPVFVQNNLI